MRMIDGKPQTRRYTTSHLKFVLFSIRAEIKTKINKEASTLIKRTYQTTLWIFKYRGISMQYEQTNKTQKRLFHANENNTTKCTKTVQKHVHADQSRTLVLAFESAPASSRSRKHSKRPFSAAQIRALYPFCEPNGCAKWMNRRRPKHQSLTKHRDTSVSAKYHAQTKKTETTTTINWKRYTLK